MSKTIKFGTDGWRAIIAEEFTHANVKTVTHALARTFEPEKKPRQKIYIGYDNRFMADDFAKTAAKVLSTYDYEARLIPHPVSSPWLSFITWKEKSPFGVMITASHNPAEYCGFKVKGSFGGSIPEARAKQIEESLEIVLANGDALGSRPASGPVKLKSFSDFKLDIQTPYIQYLQSHLDMPLIKKSKGRVLFDVMYGSGSPTVSAFFGRSKSRLNVETLHDRRDPLFGGLHPEPIEEYLGDLKKAVKDSKCLAGFALDGDADRLGLVDDKGVYLTPQQAFALMLHYLAAEKKLTGKVVQAVSLGYLSERIAKDHNLPFEEVPVGFKYVAEKILEGGVLAGGEESGGYAVGRTNTKTKYGSILPERDGFFSAMLLLEMILRLNKPLSQILQDLQKKYGASCYLRNDVRLHKPIEDKTLFIEKIKKKLPSKWGTSKIAELRTLDGLKIVLEDGSWILIRPSGTEPLLRTYAEFSTAALAKDALERIGKIIETAGGSK